MDELTEKQPQTDRQLKVILITMYYSLENTRTCKKASAKNHSAIYACTMYNVCNSTETENYMYRLQHELLMKLVVSKIAWLASSSQIHMKRACSFSKGLACSIMAQVQRVYMYLTNKEP